MLFSINEKGRVGRVRRKVTWSLRIMEVEEAGALRSDDLGSHPN